MNAPENFREQADDGVLTDLGKSSRKFDSAGPVVMPRLRNMGALYRTPIDVIAEQLPRCVSDSPTHPNSVSDYQVSNPFTVHT